MLRLSLLLNLGLLVDSPCLVWSLNICHAWYCFILVWFCFSFYILSAGKTATESEILFARASAIVATEVKQRDENKQATDRGTFIFGIKYIIHIAVQFFTILFCLIVYKFITPQKLSDVWTIMNVHASLLKTKKLEVDFLCLVCLIVLFLSCYVIFVKQPMNKQNDRLMLLPSNWSKKIKRRKSKNTKQVLLETNQHQIQYLMHIIHASCGVV